MREFSHLVCCCWVGIFVFHGSRVAVSRGSILVLHVSVIFLWFVIVGVLGLTLVSDVSDVTGVAIDVVFDNLTATVGENNVVRSVGIVSLAVLLGAKVNVKVIVLNVVIVVVFRWGLINK